MFLLDTPPPASETPTFWDDVLAVVAETGGKALQVVAIIVGAFLLAWILRLIIRRVVKRIVEGAKSKANVDDTQAIERSPLAGVRVIQRTRTLGSILQNITNVTVVVIDIGGPVEPGYNSDSTRTYCFDDPPAEIADAYAAPLEAQRAAVAAVRPGVSASSIDAAARDLLAERGLADRFIHRTGHGIGLDGHEPVNLVHGETTKLAPGMCFSDEPGIYIPGAFGVRLEDCFHMTEAGPKWFSTPPPSLDKPFG